MRRRLAGIGIAVALFGAMGVTTASAVQASTCTSVSTKVTAGDVTTTDTTRTCKLDRGGWSKTVTHGVSVKTSEGTVKDTRTVSDGRSVSKKGKVTVRHSVRTCHKNAGASQVCRTVSTTK
jgi:hypothetical protein